MIQKFFIYLSFITFFTVPSFASDQRDFSYQGQPEESLDLRTYVTETRYRDRIINETCYRQEPYTDRECRNETSYRQSCSVEPGRRVCRTEPSRRVCRVQNGRRVCSTIPGRTICRTEPGRRVCRSVPYTRRICRDVTRYRNVPYTCQRTVREPYEVQIDHIVNVKVEFQGQSNEVHDFRVDLDNSLNVGIRQLNTTRRASVLMDTIRNVRNSDRTIYLDIIFKVQFAAPGRANELPGEVISPANSLL